MPRTIVTDFVFNAVSKGRGLRETRDDVDDLNEALYETDDAASAAGRGSEGATGRFNALGKAAGLAGKALGGGLALGAGVAVGAIGTAFRDFNELSGAMNMFSAQTGIAGDELDAYRDIAKDVFAGGWGDSMQDVVATMSQVRNITGASGQELETLTRYAEIFTDTFDADVNETIRAADTAMEAFGESGTDVFDLLTAGMQQTGDPGKDLLDTFNEYSNNFAEMGFSAEQFLSLLNQGLQNGARNTDDIADGMREFQIRLKDGTSEASIMALGLGDLNRMYKNGEVNGAAMFEAIIGGLNDIEDPIKRNQLGVELFGTKWEDAGEAAFLALDPTSIALENVEGATDRAGDALSRGLGPSWNRFSRTVRMGLVSALGPFIEQGLTVLTDWLVKAGDTLEQLMGGIRRFGMDSEWVRQKLMSIFGAGVGDAVFEFVNGIIDGFNTIKDAFERGGLKEVGKTILDALAKGLSDIPGWVMDNVITPIATYLSGIDWGEVQSKAAELLGKLLVGALVISTWVYDNVIQPVIDYLSGIDWAGVGSKLIDLLLKLIGSATNIIAEVGAFFDTYVVQPIVTYLSGVNWAGIASRLVDLLDKFVGLAGAGLASMGVWAWDNLISPLISYLSNVNWSGLASRLVDLLSQFLGLAGAGLVSMGVWAWDNLISPLISYLSNVNWAGVVNRLADLLGTLLGTVGSGIEAVGQWAYENIVQPIIDKFSSQDTWTSLFNSAKNLGAQIFDGLIDALSGLAVALAKLIDDALPDRVDFGSIHVPDMGPLGGGYDANITIDLPDDPIQSLMRDVGGVGLPGMTYKIGQGRYTEYFIPNVAGEFVPERATGRARGGGGGITIMGDLVLNGVQNVAELRRQLQREARRHNVGAML